jgi:CheY-like chemotaxis protein
MTGKTKRVLGVGNCSIDHLVLSRMFRHEFGATLAQAEDLEDALDAIRRGAFDLVIVNRRIYADQGDGIEAIRRIKEDAELGQTPVMLLSDLAEAQEAAIAAGAEPGFGKGDMNSAETLRNLARLLGVVRSQPS